MVSLRLAAKKFFIVQCNGPLHRTKLCALCLMAATLITVALYIAAATGKAYVSASHGSYAVNLSELLMAMGYGLLNYHLWQSGGSAEGLSAVSLLLSIASYITTLVGVIVHPNPFECYVPCEGMLGSTTLFIVLMLTEIVLLSFAFFRVCCWHITHGDAAVQDMPVPLVSVCLFIILFLNLLMTRDCGSVIGDMIWTLSYSLTTTIMIPQMWVVAQLKRVTWPVANLVVCFTLATVIELFSDLVGMESKASRNSDYGAHCLMYVWADMLALGISADFVYWYFYSLSHDYEDKSMRLPN